MLLSWIYLFIALLSLIYYGVCIVYAWAGVSWLWIWPLLAAFCIVRAVMLRAKAKGKYNPPRWLTAVFRTVLALFAASFIIIEGIIIGGINSEAPDGLDYIIVLGAAVRGREPATPLLLRMMKACEYLTENPGTIAVASGGQGLGEDISEAECIRNYLTEHGIEESRILLEAASRDTDENIRNSFAIIGDDDAEAGIVTNSFHIFRALTIAHRQGHENVCGVPARTLLPLGIHYTVREYFGMMQLYARELLRG